MVFLSTNNAFANVTEAFCLIKISDLRAAKLAPSEYSRFAGKEISFLISYEDNLIADVSEDGEVSVITGMYGVMDVQEFEKIHNGVRYKHEIKLKGEKENEFVKYNYVNIVKIINNKPTELLAKVDQSGISFNSWNFQIDCRDYKFSEEEKLKAKDIENTPGMPDWFKPLIKRLEENKKEKFESESGKDK